MFIVDKPISNYNNSIQIVIQLNRVAQTFSNICYSFAPQDVIRKTVEQTRANIFDFSFDDILYSNSASSKSEGVDILQPKSHMSYPISPQVKPNPFPNIKCHHRKLVHRSSFAIRTQEAYLKTRGKDSNICLEI